MARKRTGRGQMRSRYRAAGWAGLGLLAAFLVGAGIWVFTGGPPDRVARSPESRPALEPLPPEEKAPRKEPREGPSEKPGLLDRGPRAAIIIDDLGNSWSQARAITSLPYPVAVSVLPGTPFAERIARRAHKRGKEVLVHVPMEPGDPSIELDPRFLRADMGRRELLATLGSDLAKIPHAQGINNHMGSRLTARDQPMQWVMESLRRRGLFFIDSRTTPHSRALAQARTEGVPATNRDIFLDHHMDPKAIRAQFRELLAEAKERGTALAIGHPHPATIEILRRWLPRASAHGVEIVPVQEVLAVRSLRVAGAANLAYRRDESGEGAEP